MACRLPGAVGEGEGAHPAARRAECRAAQALTVEIGKRYVFEGAEGRAGLLGLFEDRGQLLMLKHRLMWLFGEGRACLLKWRRRLWQACTWPWREA